METTNKIEVLLRGFDIDVVNSCRSLCTKYKRLIRKMETSLEIYDKMSKPKFCDDAINSSNASFKGFDNDSGYISQAVESNSSAETTGDNRFMEAMASSSITGTIYVSEDALLEKPHILPKDTDQVEDNDEEYQEFDHLFFMSSVSAPILDSSVTSRNTNFSGFEDDESGVSEVSAIIPVATPLKVSSNVLNEDKTNSVTNQICLKKNDKDVHNFIDDLKENDPNYLNVKSNVKRIDPGSENDSVDNKSLHDKNTFNEQSSIMDTNISDTSFESFYAHLCGLYTRSDFPAEDFSKISINPNSLHNFGKEKDQENAACNSPYKNSYVELETVSKESNVEFASTTSCSLEYGKQDEIFTNTVGKGSYIELEGINKKTTIITCDGTDVTTSPVRNSKIRQSHDLLSENQLSKTQDSNIQKGSLTPLRQYKHPANLGLSPELFSDEESWDHFSHNESFSFIQKVCEQKYITKNDRKLLQRAQESLCGVLPPPSVTIIQMSVNEILQRINDNKHLFAINSVENLVDNCDIVNETRNKVQRKPISSGNLKSESLLVTCKKEDFDPGDWPNIIHFRYHGLHFNRNKINEDFERLCLKYAERYIGAETQSSCTIFRTDILSPSKRKCKFKRVAKSPGKRLSHLARRLSFTNVASQFTAGSSSLIGARTRQIVVDARKCELLSRRKSPRKKSPRKTPRKSPRKRSNILGSSSKKRLNEDDSLSSIASTSSSRASVTKRALFQSPSDKGETTNGLLQLFGSNLSNESSQSAKRSTPRRALFNSPLKSSPSKMSISSLYPAKRKMTPKRALFMSPEKSPKRIENCDRKRKRIDSESDQLNKISRSMSSEFKLSLNESGSQSKTITRSQSLTSSSFQTQDILAHRKKKMLWAIAEALRSQNIDMKHPQFKVFASVLARLIRHFLPNFFTNGPRPEGSSTESMLRVARQHVFAVTRGKTVVQIIKEVESKVRIPKPSGYVGLEKVDKSAELSSRNKENVLQDPNIIGRLQPEASHLYKNSRPANVERIRKVINFGDEADVKNQSTR